MDYDMAVITFRSDSISLVEPFPLLHEDQTPGQLEVEWDGP